MFRVKDHVCKAQLKHISTFLRFSVRLDGRVYIFTRKRWAALELAVPEGDNGFLRWAPREQLFVFQLLKEFWL